MEKGISNILALRSWTILIPLYATAPGSHIKNSTEMYFISAYDDR